MREGWLCPRCNVVHSPDMKKCLQCDPSLDKTTVTVNTPFMQDYSAGHTLTTCPKCNMIIDADLPHDCEEAKPYGVRMPMGTHKCYICGMNHYPGVACPDVSTT